MKHRGFTLIELLLVAAIVALFASLGLPAYTDYSARQRLGGAAEALALELQQARFDAVQSGRMLHVELQGGPQWCFTVSHEAGCDCRLPGPAACALRRGSATEHRDVEMASPRSSSFDARMGRAAPGKVAELSLGTRLAEVQLMPSGRARACGRDVDLPGLPRC